MTKLRGPLTLLVVGSLAASSFFVLFHLDPIAFEGVVMTPVGFGLFYVACIGGGALAIVGLVWLVVAIVRGRRSNLPWRQLDT